MRFNRGCLLKESLWIKFEIKRQKMRITKNESIPEKSILEKKTYSRKKYHPTNIRITKTRKVTASTNSVLWYIAPTTFFSFADAKDSICNSCDVLVIVFLTNIFNIYLEKYSPAIKQGEVLPENISFFRPYIVL